MNPPGTRWLGLVEGMHFEWDADKARSNLRKHAVSFDAAAAALRDPMAVTLPDPDHSIDEIRMITVCCSPGGQVLTIAHTERELAVRIISARKATRDERGLYEQI